MKRIFTFTIILMALTACTAPQAQPSMPNPARVYCEQNGNKHGIHTAADGSQSGICVFPDGSTCDEWAYYRGECGPAAQKGPTLAMTGGLIVTHLLAGPTGEEAGWRGFALPRLLEKYSPLSAAIISGIIRGFWHLPLWIIGGSRLLYCLFFSIGIISLSVLMTWIFRRTSTSLVPMIIIHFSYNVGFYLIGPQGMGLGPTFPLTAIMATLCLLTAIVVCVAGGLRAGSDQPISR